MSRPLRSFANPDLGGYRFAGAQLVLLVRPRIEHDLDRNALHNLDIVSGGVLWRQEAEARAAGSGNAVDFSVVLSAIRIDFNGDLLSRPHVAELRLLKVPRNPNVVKIDDLHQFLTRSDVLADFDGAVADETIHGRDDLGVLQVQFSLIQIGLFALRFG